MMEKDVFQDVFRRFWADQFRSLRPFFCYSKEMQIVNKWYFLTGYHNGELVIWFTMVVPPFFGYLRNGISYMAATGIIMDT